MGASTNDKSFLFEQFKDFIMPKNEFYGIHNVGVILGGLSLQFHIYLLIPSSFGTRSFASNLNQTIL
jgi:hypothetical protein